MPRVQLQFAPGVCRPGRQVAHHLVAEEVEGDAVLVGPGQLAAEQLDIEVLGLGEVTGRPV